MSEISEEPVIYSEEEILPFGRNRYGQVYVYPNKKSKKKLTIESWTDAFSIYSSVLRQASPNPSKLAEELQLTCILYVAFMKIMASGIATMQLFVLWKHRIAPWNRMK